MFTLVHHYKYTLTELENMIPWERDMYIGMVNSWAKEEADKLKQQSVESQQEMQKMIKTIRSKKRR